jgi:type IV pilus assembly protein PilC
MSLLPLKTSCKELCLFTRQLSSVLKAGIPLLAALETLRNQSRSHPLQLAIDRVHATLVDGGTLAKGFAATPTIFGRLYVSLISAGERAGILDQTLSTLARSLERAHSLRSRMLRAAIYPLLVLVTMCAVTIFLLCWVIPTFEDLFQENGARLPWLTHVVLKLSRDVNSYWSYILAGVGFVLLGISWAFSRISAAAETLERFILRLPVVATLVRAKVASEISLLLSSLLSAGIPILEALEICAETIQHTGLSRELHDARTVIIDGGSLTESLKRSTVLPAMVGQMVAIGESSGQLVEILEKVGTMFEEELDATMKTLHDLAEPVLVIVIGIVVGTLVLAMYLPLFQIGDLANVR